MTMSLAQVKQLANQVQQNHEILIQDHQKIKRIRKLLEKVASLPRELHYTEEDMKTCLQIVICAIAEMDQLRIAYWTAVINQIGSDIDKAIAGQKRTQHFVRKTMECMHRVTIHYNQVMDEQTRLNAEISKLTS
jgi:hypothetical protein